MRILVTGATGYVGSRLVAELIETGHDVVAATRDPSKLGQFGWCDRVQAVYLDADDPSSVAAAFTVAAPVDVVYYLVHAIGQPDFRDRDNAAAANVAAAAAAAGVRRIVYLGGFVPDGDTLSEHLAGRAEVADALSVEGGPELVWLGAAVIIGAGSTSFEMVRYVGDRFWVIPLPPWAEHRMDPISVRDVLCASRPGPTTSSARPPPPTAGCWAAMSARPASGEPGSRCTTWCPRASSAGWPGRRCRCRAVWPPTSSSRWTIR